MSHFVKGAFFHILILLSTCVGLGGTLQAQSGPFQEEMPAPEGFLHYWDPIPNLENNLAAWEEIIDLFQPLTYDSILSIPTQRHRFPLAFAAEYVGGFYWEKIMENKQKFVGTCGREVSTYDSFIREFDLNYFPIPHLPAYIDRLLMGKAAMTVKGRGTHHAKVFSPNFPIDSVLYMDERGFLSMECENTPSLAKRNELDSLFFPALYGKKLVDHPNFGRWALPMGFYGPFVVDCNHDCQPEIHPYDWIWWMNPSTAQNEVHNRRDFLAGYVWDDSGRFKKWNKKIRHGKMAVPICFPLDADSLHIIIEPLAHGELQDLPTDAVDAQTLPSDFVSRTFQVRRTAIEVKQSQPLPKGVRYRLRPFHVDSREALAWGFLEMEVKVESHFTVRVRVER